MPECLKTTLHRGPNNELHLAEITIDPPEYEKNPIYQLLNPILRDPLIPTFLFGGGGPPAISSCLVAQGQILYRNAYTDKTDVWNTF